MRPHKALGQRSPQEVYYRSTREYTPGIESWQYPEGMSAKYVCRNGAIRWGSGKWINVSTTLREKYIGLEPIAEGTWRVFFRDVLLGYLDEKEFRIQDDQGRLRRNVKKV